MKQAINILLVSTLLILAQPSSASDDGPEKSYASNDYEHQVIKTVDGLIAWAKGELAEHDGEGLYKPHPEQLILTQGMIDQAIALVKKAKSASKAGNNVQAQIYYLSAESTARYAASMPHMLEARLEQ